MHRAVLAFLACLVPVPAFAGANLVKNPGFAEGDEEWSLAKPAFEVSKDVGHGDSASLHLKKDQAHRWSSCLQVVPAEPGKTYIYSVWVKTKDFKVADVEVAKFGARIYIDWVGDSGGLGSNCVTAEFPVTADWHQYTFVAPASPAGTKSIRLVVNDYHGYSGEIWFDDFQIREISDSPVTMSFPEPVWHGKFVPAGDGCEIRLKIDHNKQVLSEILGSKGDVTPVTKVRLRQHPDLPVHVDVSVDGIASVPAAPLPLGPFAMSVELADPAGNWSIYLPDEQIEKVECVSLDVLYPNSMGVVGALPDQPLELKCRVGAKVPPNAAPESFDVRLSLVPEDGSASTGKPLQRRIASGGKIDVTYPMKNVAVGTYWLKAELIKSSGEKLAEAIRLVSRVDAAKRPANAVDVLPSGLLRVDGKPFFPIGVYFLSTLDSVRVAPDELSTWKYSWEHKNPGYYLPALDLLANSPMNCLVDYGSMAGGVEETAKFLDEAGKRGVKVVFCVKDDVLTHFKKGGKATDGLALLGDKFPMAKDHRAVIAMYHDDERFEPIWWQFMVNARTEIRKADPWHPTFMVQWDFSRSLAYSKATDIYGTDPYGIMTNCPYMVQSWREARKAMGQGQPMWAVVQSFSPAIEGGNLDNIREPTYEEMRWGTFTAIAEGSTGIIYYALHCMQRSPQFAKQWRSLCKVAAEVQELVPVIGLRNAARPAAAEKGELCLLSKDGDGKLYLILTSPLREKQVATVRWPNGIKCVTDRQSGQVFKLSGNVTELDLEPLAVRVLVGEFSN